MKDITVKLFTAQELAEFVMDVTKSTKNDFTVEQGYIWCDDIEDEMRIDTRLKELTGYVAPLVIPTKNKRRFIIYNADDIIE